MALLFPTSPLIDLFEAFYEKDYFRTQMRGDEYVHTFIERFKDAVEGHPVYALPGFFALPLKARLYLTAFGKKAPQYYTQDTRWEDEVSRARRYNPLNWLSFGVNYVLSVVQLRLMQWRLSGFHRYKKFVYRTQDFSNHFNRHPLERKIAVQRLVLTQFKKDGRFDFKAIDRHFAPTRQERWQRFSSIWVPSALLCLLHLVSMCADALLAPAFASKCNIAYIKFCLLRCYKHPIKTIASFACAAGLGYEIYLHIGAPLVYILQSHAWLSLPSLMTLVALSALFVVFAHLVLSCTRIVCHELIPLIRKFNQDYWLIENKARLSVIEGGKTIMKNTDRFVHPQQPPSQVGSHALLGTVHFAPQVISHRNDLEDLKWLETWGTNEEAKRQWKAYRDELDKRIQLCHDNLPAALENVTCFWDGHFFSQRSDEIEPGVLTRYKHYFLGEGALLDGGKVRAERGFVGFCWYKKEREVFAQFFDQSEQVAGPPIRIPAQYLGDIVDNWPRTSGIWPDGQTYTYSYGRRETTPWPINNSLSSFMSESLQKFVISKSGHTNPHHPEMVMQAYYVYRYSSRHIDGVNNKGTPKTPAPPNDLFNIHHVPGPTERELWDDSKAPKNPFFRFKEDDRPEAKNTQEEIERSQAWKRTLPNYDPKLHSHEALERRKKQYRRLHRNIKKSAEGLVLGFCERAGKAYIDLPLPDMSAPAKCQSSHTLSPSNPIRPVTQSIFEEKEMEETTVWHGAVDDRTDDDDTLPLMDGYYGGDHHAEYYKSYH